jgi:hypothetical protein
VTCMQMNISEIARRYRFGAGTVYAWVCRGQIPARYILRQGNEMQIDSDEFDRLLKAGRLYRPRGRKADEQARRSGEVASAVGFSEDQHTTKREGNHYQHRFVLDNCTVSEDHPYRPVSISRTR